MKGSIEIYNGNDLVYENDNLLVDGAGESFVDLLTVSPSLSEVASASALLDTSNYTIQAISFGKGKTGFLNNAHRYDSSAGDISVDTKETFYAVCGIATGYNQPVVVAFTTDKDTGVHTSSLSVAASLPESPTPLDTLLERGVQLEGGAFTASSSIIYDANYNATIESMGQNANFLPYMNEVGFRVGSEGLASYVGCYPAGSGTHPNGTDWYLASDPSDMNSLFDFPTLHAYFDESAKNEGRVVSGTYGSYINAASSMDIRGYMGKVWDPNGRVGLEGAGDASGTASGLVVTSVSPSTTGEVSYSTTLGPGDCGMSHLFGGIYTMGLWTIDNTSTAAQTAPYTFHPYESPQIQYRLFSKHSMSKDLTYVQDRGSNAGLNSYNDLSIVWKLDFYD
tara:strand:+ start:19304 stop:20485 length:1182 start_codon:yes stop_codon:yes gene_type:complete